MQRSGKQAVPIHSFLPAFAKARLTVLQSFGKHGMISVSKGLQQTNCVNCF